MGVSKTTIYTVCMCRTAATNDVTYYYYWVWENPHEHFRWRDEDSHRVYLHCMASAGLTKSDEWGTVNRIRITYDVQSKIYYLYMKSNSVESSWSCFWLRPPPVTFARLFSTRPLLLGPPPDWSCLCVCCWVFFKREMVAHECRAQICYHVRLLDMRW